MFNDDDDKNKNQDLMKSPVYGLIPSSPTDGLMSSGKDNIKSKWHIYTRDPGNGQIQGPHAGINLEEIGKYVSMETANITIESWMLKQRMDTLVALTKVFEGCPSLNLPSCMFEGWLNGMSKINKLQDQNIGGISVDEYGEEEEDDDQT